MAEPSEAPGRPDVLLRIANLKLPVKPVRSARTHPEPFSSPHVLARALGVERVEDAQVESLRDLHGLVVDVVDRLLAGRRVGTQAERLTDLARASAARVRLVSGPDGGLAAGLEWSDPDPASSLARRLISDLGALDVTRLRRCARPECDLVFYDTTRSGTRRWHAESPCGTRERQRRHRESKK